MTRVNVPEQLGFDFMSDEELSDLIRENQIQPEIELTDDMIIGEDDLAYHVGPTLEVQQELDFGDDPLDALFATPGSPLLDYSEEDWISALDLAFEEATTPTVRFEKGVGYCENVECADYLKGMFLFLHEKETFTCGSCGQESTHMVQEKGIVEREGIVPFACVRVEYCYDAARRRYDEIVVLTDDSFQGPSGTYTIQNPLCKTPTRAAKIAEAMLNVINEGVLLDEDLSNTPKAYEKILSFDKPADEFRKDLKALEHSLMDNSFLQRTPSVVSTPSEVELTLEEGDASGPQSNAAGGTTDAQSGIPSPGDGGTGALYLYDRRQPGGLRSERTEGRLYSVQPLGTGSANLRRGKGQGRRGWNHRTAARKLRATAGRIFTSILRSTSRGSTSGT